jgi:hypothetical protein
MSDDKQPIVPEAMQGEFLELVEDIVSDPGSRGFTICGVGPQLGAIAHTVSDEEYETHVALCAVILKEHVAGLEVDGEEFVRDVIEEYNERDVSHQSFGDD